MPLAKVVPSRVVDVRIFQWISKKFNLLVERHETSEDHQIQPAYSTKSASQEA